MNSGTQFENLPPYKVIMLLSTKIRTSCVKKTNLDYCFCT